MNVKQLRIIVDDLESQLSVIRDLGDRIMDGKGTYAGMREIGTDTKPIYRDVLTVEMDLSYHLTVMKETLILWEGVEMMDKDIAESKYDRQDSNSGRDSG